jgi:hypothetical protein
MHKSKAENKFRLFLSIRDVQLLGTFARGACGTGPEIKEQFGWNRSGGLFTSVMRRFRRHKLVHCSDSWPRRYWLSELGLQVYREAVEDFRREVGRSDCEPIQIVAAPGPMLPAPGEAESELRSPDLREMKRILSSDDVAQEFKFACEVLQAWPRKASELPLLKLGDVYFEDGVLRVQNRLVDGLLKTAILKVFDARMGAPVFEMPRGYPWTRESYRLARKQRRHSPQSDLFTQAIACGKLNFRQLTGITLSDARAADHRVWVGIGAERVSLALSPRLGRLIREAVQMALDTALLRNIYGFAWDVKSISKHFRRIARKLGIPDNAQFPGPDKLRMDLVRRTLEANEDENVLGIDLAADAKQPGTWFSEYFPPKKWIPRFGCSRRNWPKVKVTYFGEDHPVLASKMVRFPLAELHRANVSPPESTNAHIAHIAHIAQKQPARTA